MGDGNSESLLRCPMIGRLVYRIANDKHVITAYTDQQEGQYCMDRGDPLTQLESN